MGHHLEFMQQNWLAIVKTKEAEAIEQAPTLTQPAAASSTLAQPAKASAAPLLATQPSASQSQKSPKYCATCTATGQPCPTEYLIPIKADW